MSGKNIWNHESSGWAGWDPAEIYQELTREFGEPVYERVEAPATPEQKTLLAKLSPQQVKLTELAGEKIQAVLTHALGNGAPIGGLKVISESGWFAARPSGTESIYKIYVESFRGSLPVSTFTGGSMRAAFLMRDNFHHRRDIEAAYLQAIRQAKFEIILAHACFLPGLKFRHALIDAAARGVRVILMLQGRVEIFLQHYASRALYGHFLDAGIEIYEYRKSFLHAKVAVIDGHWATVGSSNIDPFSLLLSLEANVVVDDGAFGTILSQSLRGTIEKDGQQILTDGWKQQPVYLRFLSWLCYGLLPLLQAISGYASEHKEARKE